MGVYKKYWYYKTPEINGDTIATRKSTLLDGFALEVHLNGPSSYVKTFYYDMNGGGRRLEVETINPKSAIKETREVIRTTPKEDWEEKPFTFDDLRKAVYNLYNLGKKRFFTR